MTTTSLLRRCVGHVPDLGHRPVGEVGNYAKEKISDTREHYPHIGTRLSTFTTCYNDGAPTSMRVKYQLIDIKHAIFHLRKSQGKYLSDVTYEDLSQEAMDDLLQDAELLLKSGVELRRVVRKGKYVWRFMNKNGL